MAAGRQSLMILRGALLRHGDRSRNGRRGMSRFTRPVGRRPVDRHDVWRKSVVTKITSSLSVSCIDRIGKRMIPGRREWISRVS